MKFIQFYGALLTAVLMMACGSGEDDPIGPETPDLPNKPSTPEVTVPDGEEDYFAKDMIFESKGGEKTIAFKSTVDWTITSTATNNKTQWCSIHPTSGKAGEFFVKVKAEENPFYDERNQTLTLTASSLKKNVRIIQKQKNALTLTTNKFEVDAKGGEIKVVVNTNIKFDVVIPEKYTSWIKQTSKSRGLSTSNLVFIIAASEESEKREGEIIIKSDDLSETVHVYQTGQKILLLSKNEYSVPSDGETIKVELKSNFDYAIKMPPVDWIAKDNSSRGLSSHTLYYKIQTNSGYDPREAKILFFDKDSDITDTLHIVQDQKNAILIKQKEFNVKAEGDVIHVKLNRNIDYSIQIEGNWITQTSTRGLVEDVLSFTIKANKDTAKRSGKIIFSNKNNKLSESVIVNQYGNSNDGGDAGGTAPDFPWE